MMRFKRVSLWSPMLAVALLLAGAQLQARDWPPTNELPVPEAANPAIPIAGFSVSQRRLADRIVSVFENNTPDLQYGYAEYLNDGRGITAGRAGFTTGTRDLLEVLERYERLHPGSEFAPLLPVLRKRAHEWSGSIEGLTELPRLWREHAEDPLLRQVQDEVVESMYLARAVSFAQQAGLVRPLSLLLVYDAILQHGFSPYDPDGLPKLLRCAREDAGGTPASNVDETQWALAFLSVREGVLRGSNNAATRQVWAKSAARVDSLRTLVEQGHWQLDRPVTINPWGREFTIDGSVAG